MVKKKNSSNCITKEELKEVLEERDDDFISSFFTGVAIGIVVIILIFMAIGFANLIDKNIKLGEEKDNNVTQLCISKGYDEYTREESYIRSDGRYIWVYNCNRRVLSEDGIGFHNLKSGEFTYKDYFKE